MSWIQHWQLNVSFKHLGESWNKVKDLSKLGLIWQGWAKHDLFRWALSSWMFAFQVGWIIWICDQYMVQRNFCILVSCLHVAKTECCSFQKAAELCACYLGLLCLFRLGTTFPLFSCQSKVRNEWVLLGLKIYSEPNISGLYISCKKNFSSTFLWESSTSPEWLPNSLKWRLQVAQTWILLKHSRKMISVMNTSALSTVSVLVLLQLVWSIFGAIQWLALW